MSRKKSFYVVVLVALSLACTWISSAQAHVLDELYGIGVHRFFNGNYPGSTEFLTRAIDEGSTDPRCFYFRGLAWLQLNDDQAARDDFKKGAQFEFSRAAHYTVSRSLERIQGPPRLLLESYRREGRIRAHGLRPNDQDATRVPRNPGASEQAAPTPEEAGAADNDPFGNKAEDRPVGIGPTEVAPEREVPADEQPDSDSDDSDTDEDIISDDENSDPFGDESSPFDGDDKEEDPFSEGDEEEDPFSEGDEEEDPFGEGNDEEDPFADTEDQGDKPVPRDEEVDDPFAADEEEEDPFAEDNESEDQGDKPIPIQAAEDKPVPRDEEVDDPFAADEEEEDPFADTEDQGDKPEPKSVPSEEEEEDPFAEDTESEEDPFAEE